MRGGVTYVLKIKKGERNVLRKPLQDPQKIAERVMLREMLEEAETDLVRLTAIRESLWKTYLRWYPHGYGWDAVTKEIARVRVRRTEYYDRLRGINVECVDLTEDCIQYAAESAYEEFREEAELAARRAIERDEQVARDAKTKSLLGVVK